MSYLLTEIALEMLGYKFYDIEGKLGATSFQINGLCTSATAKNNSEHVEDTLESILELNASDVLMDEPLNFSVIECAPPKLECSEQIVFNAEEVPHNQFAKFEKIVSPGSGNKKQFSNALSKLLDHEYDRIRSEIERKKNAFHQSITEHLKGCDERHKAQLMQTLICNFKDQEQNKLQEEFHTMHTFRKLVEQVLNKLNSENYEKYKHTFLQK